MATTPSSLIHWDLMVGDVEQAKRFYGAVLGWRFVPAGPEYTMIDTGAAPGGGLMPRPPGVAISALNSYFRVDDIDDTLRRVVEAGGEVTVPRTEIPGVGWFAMFLDPDRISVGLLQPLPGM